MTTLVYLHGFLSSPLSFKARATKAWLADHHPQCQFVCPDLSPYPHEAQASLEALAEQLPRPLRLVGSSLGGFWARYLAERYAARAVLINPAVAPQKVVDSLVGVRVKNYYTDAFYTLTPACAALLRGLAGAPVRRHERYWLLLQTGDETLDYRDAVAHFAGARQTVIAGGDHAFSNYEVYLPAIYQFLMEP